MAPSRGRQLPFSVFARRLQNGVIRRFSTEDHGSRFAQIQKLYNEHLREWYWQRNMGTKYQTWLPPGVIFCALKKDHFDIGPSNVPTWENWWFHDLDKPLVVVVGSGLWALNLAYKNPEYNVLYTDCDDKNIFNTLLRAMEVYQINTDGIEPFFNFRIMFGNYRLFPQVLPDGDLFKPTRLHLHFPPRQKTLAQNPGSRAIASFEAQGLPKSLHKVLIPLMAEHGTIHIASDNLDQAQAIASQILELKRVYDPVYPFPFFQEGLPTTYGKLPLDTTKPVFYQEWRKSDRKLPNALFKGKMIA